MSWSRNINVIRKSLRLLERDCKYVSEGNKSKMCLVIKSHRARFSWFVAHILLLRHVVFVAINSIIDSLLSREFPPRRAKKETVTTHRALNLAKAKPNFHPFFLRYELIPSWRKRAPLLLRRFGILISNFRDEQTFYATTTRTKAVVSAPVDSPWNYFVAVYGD